MCKIWRPSFVLRTHQFVERRHDFQQKGTTRNVRDSSKITFLGVDPAQKNRICFVFVILMSPYMEDSLAKAVCNNDDSLCCNYSKFIVERIKICSKRAISSVRNPIIDTFGKICAQVICTWYDVE